MTERLEKLAQRLPVKTEAGCADALLITSQVNQGYLTGFDRGEGALLITRKAAYLLVDFRYVEDADRKAVGCQVILYERLAEKLHALLQEQGAKRVLTEQRRIPLAEWEGLKKSLPKVAFLSDPWLDRALDEMRMFKSAEEIENLRRAQEITEQAFSYALELLRPGVSEREAALALEFYMRKQGAQGISFDLIVVAGPNSALPHGVPGDRPLQKGDFVTMDTGAVYGGMHADMTRTVAIGSVTDEQREVYETVLRAQQAGIAAARPGVPGREVDSAARSVIEKAGYGRYFGHSTGHGVGFEIHEHPNFSPRSEQVACAGMVITVEPGIYLPGRFGVRIEDMVLITKEGCEDLTHAPKELLVL